MVELDEVVRRFAFAPAEESERGKEGRRGKSRDRQIIILQPVLLKAT